MTGPPYLRFLTRIVVLQRRRQLAPVPAGVGVQAFDRSPLCTLALARWLGLDVPAALAAEVERVVRDSVVASPVFLVRPLGFVEPTAVRRIGYADSVAFGTVHEQVYREHGYRLVDVAPAAVEERVRAVERALRASG